MKIGQFFTLHHRAHRRRCSQEAFIVEPMEPRLLLSADALGIDAGVLSLEQHETRPFGIDDRCRLDSGGSHTDC